MQLRKWNALPLPEAETVGRLARLLGGSCSVGVGLAETAAARRADVRAKDFMVGSSAFVWGALTDRKQVLLFSVEAAGAVLLCCYSGSKQEAAREWPSERSESMCQLERRKRIVDPTKRVSRASRMGDKKYLAINNDGWNAL